MNDGEKDNEARVRALEFDITSACHNSLRRPRTEGGYLGPAVVLWWQGADWVWVLETLGTWV